MDGVIVHAVIVKGGPNANVYEYDPVAIEDSGLHAPVDPQDEQFFDISRVSFCYDEPEITGPLPPPPIPPVGRPEPEPRGRTGRGGRALLYGLIVATSNPRDP